MKTNGVTTAGIINVPTSSMAREVDLLLSTHAGPEIGVASTKAVHLPARRHGRARANLARAKGSLPADEERDIVAICARPRQR
jgi:glucosamine--fructose-6-phosphate aminotransferase (isomerizing)